MAMPKKGRNIGESSTPDIHPDLIRGDFDREGSWMPNAENRSIRWRFVDSLVAARRAHPEMGPREFAMRMRALPLWHEMERMFPYIELWLDLSEPYAWAGVPCSTSAESAIKYEGRGSFDERHWWDAEYREGRDNSPVTKNAHELVKAMALRLGYQEHDTGKVEEPGKPREMTPEERAEKIRILREKGWGMPLADADRIRPLPPEVAEPEPTPFS